MFGASKGLHGRPRSVSREIQHSGSASQLLPPVGCLLVQDCSLQALTLPGGEIGIANGQIGERDRIAGDVSTIERSEFAIQDRFGRYVPCDVVGNK